jgi:hypothetical protein
MGWQRWLVLDVTFVQPTPILYGLMVILKLKGFGYINASSVVQLAQKTWLSRSIPKNL